MSCVCSVGLFLNIPFSMCRVEWHVGRNVSSAPFALLLRGNCAGFFSFCFFFFFSVYHCGSRFNQPWKPHAKYNLGWCCWKRVGLLALVKKPIGKDHQSKSSSGKLWIELNAGKIKALGNLSRMTSAFNAWIFREKRKRLKLTFWIYFSNQGSGVGWFGNR